MTFAGLPLSTVAVVFAVAGAAVTLLYVLKLRRRRVEVPFARLWLRVLRERESSSLWRRLRRLLSLLVQLAVLGLLALAVGDPRVRRGEGARTVVLVVDASASMRAVDESPSRLERAKAEARRIVAGLGAGDAAVVVRLDGQPQALGGLEQSGRDDRELERQIDSIAASDTPADLDRALRLAADVLHGQPRPTLVLVGDGAGWQPVLDRVTRKGGGGLAAIDLAGVDLRWIPVGKSGDNLGIVGFAVRRYPQNRASYEVFVEVQSFRDSPSVVTLELLQDGEVVDVQKLALAAHEKQARFYPNLAGAGTRLEARLADAGDPFPLDDHAFALLPPMKKQRVLLVSPGNLFLEGALLLDENAAVDKLAPAAWDDKVAAGYDAVVLDAFTPPAPPPVPAIWLDPSGPSSPFTIAGDLRAPYVTDVAEKHPLMRWVTLRDVNMTRASRFALAPGDVALASSARQPIMVARESPHKAVAIGFDVRKSDLPLRVAFPVLLINALEWFAGGEATLQASYATGKTWRIPLPGDQATVTDPDGAVAKAPIVDGSARWYGRKVGFYTIVSSAARDKPRALAASLADPAESAIAPARELRVDGAALAQPEGFAVGVRRELWALLVLAALAVILVEWWTYNRRITV